jgi:hypothetical protein
MKGSPRRTYEQLEEAYRKLSDIARADTIRICELEAELAQLRAERETNFNDIADILEGYSGTYGTKYLREDVLNYMKRKKEAT